MAWVGAPSTDRSGPVPLPIGVGAVGANLDSWPVLGAGRGGPLAQPPPLHPTGPGFVWLPMPVAGGLHGLPLGAPGPVLHSPGVSGPSSSGGHAGVAAFLASLPSWLQAVAMAQSPARVVSRRPDRLTRPGRAGPGRSDLMGRAGGLREGEEVALATISGRLLGLDKRVAGRRLHEARRFYGEAKPMQKGPSLNRSVVLSLPHARDSCSGLAGFTPRKPHLFPNLCELVGAGLRSDVTWRPY